MIDSIVQDIRLALRGLFRARGFAIPAVLTLALGIGGTTAMYALVHGVLLRPLPFAEPDRLVVVTERRQTSSASDLPVSGHEYVAWKERNRVFSDIALIRPGTVVLTRRGEPVSVLAASVSGEAFRMLGVRPVVGTTFGETDEAVPPAVVVLSERLWRERFNRDSTVIGQSVTLDDRPYSVIGIVPDVPQSFGADVWLPLDVAAEAQAVGRHSLQVIARLARDVTLGQARADLERIARQLERELPSENTDHRTAIAELREAVAGDARLPLILLLGATGFVLLIACANVANLVLARTLQRQHEVAIRVALGASRARLLRTVLTECLLLSLAGASGGVLVASWLVDVVPLMPGVGIPFLDLVRIDTPVLLAALALAILTGLLSGLAPAIRVAHSGSVRRLRDGARVADDRRGRRIRSSLVTAEVALALILLIGSGLLFNSFVRLMRVDPGFTSDNVLVAPFTLPSTRYATAESRRAFFDALLARLDGAPGIANAGATSQLPLGGADNWMSFTIGGRPEPAPGNVPSAQFRVVTPDYFRTLGIPLRDGRFFTTGDARLALPLIRWFPQQPLPPNADAPQPVPVVIVSESAARAYWPDENPVGRRIRVLFSPEMTIVGVVGDVRHNALQTPAYPQFYLLHAQEPWGAASLLVRTTQAAPQHASAVREHIRALDPELPVTVRTMDDVVSASAGQPRAYAMLVGAFAFAALVLALVGVFGVVSYTTAQRNAEIGIRMALGAANGDVLGMVLRDGMRPILAGIALGIGGALALTGVLERLLFDIAPADPGTFAAVAALMTIVALGACWLPAQRAMRVSPLDALRND
jgi:putative ABC transport system permease protein